jgi:hypothetical protein
VWWLWIKRSHITYPTILASHQPDHCWVRTQLLVRQPPLAV